MKTCVLTTAALCTLRSEIALKSPADGYTLLLISSSYTPSSGFCKNLEYDPLNDMTPVIQTENRPHVITVHPSLPDMPTVMESGYKYRVNNYQINNRHGVIAAKVTAN